MNDLELMNATKEIIINAGEIALQHKSNLTVKYKSDCSPVTDIDIKISSFIYNELSNLTPSYHVVCEERQETHIATPGEKFWLVDPIDGTQSLIVGDENYTINIALIVNNMPYLGLIYQPETAFLYYNIPNLGLMVECKGEKHIPKITKDYIAVVGRSGVDAKTAKYLASYSIISEILLIASSIKLCLLATENVDIYPKFSDTMEWDIAAGHALVNATGGKIITATGGDLLYGKKNFLNPHFIACSKRWLKQHNYLSTIV